MRLITSSRPSPAGTQVSPPSRDRAMPDSVAAAIVGTPGYRAANATAATPPLASEGGLDHDAPPSTDRNSPSASEPASTRRSSEKFGETARYWTAGSSVPVSTNRHERPLLRVRYRPEAVPAKPV